LDFCSRGGRFPDWDHLFGQAIHLFLVEVSKLGMGLVTKSAILSISSMGTKCLSTVGDEITEVFTSCVSVLGFIFEVRGFVMAVRNGAGTGGATSEDGTSSDCLRCAGVTG
jgi:hypothetical protein